MHANEVVHRYKNVVELNGKCQQQLSFSTKFHRKIVQLRKSSVYCTSTTSLADTTFCNDSCCHTQQASPPAPYCRLLSHGKFLKLIVWFYVSRQFHNNSCNSWNSNKHRIKAGRKTYLPGHCVVEIHAERSKETWAKGGQAPSGVDIKHIRRRTAEQEGAWLCDTVIPSNTALMEVMLHETQTRRLAGNSPQIESQQRSGAETLEARIRQRAENRGDTDACWFLSSHTVDH